MIKQIQLRGISRTPSDRMSEDGGLADSLNVNLKDQESCPVLAPARVSETNLNNKPLFPGESYTGAWKCLYIHKGSYYVNAILLYYSSLSGAWNIGQWTERPTGSGMSGLISLEAGEEVSDVTSIGNTLIISAGGKMYYLLYSDGKYKSLGNQIRMPKLRILPFNKNAGERPSGNILEYSFPTSASTQQGNANTSAWASMFRFLQFWDIEGSILNNGALANNALGEVYEKVAEIGAEIRDTIQTGIAARNGYSRPLMAKYSVVLYDGTEISSDPFYTTYKPETKAASVHAVTTIRQSGVEYGYPQKMTITVNQTQCFGLKLHVLDNTILEDLAVNWKDVVRGVKVYVSQDLAIPAPNTISGVKIANRTDTTSAVECDMIMESDEKSMADLISDTGNYYLLKEFSIQDLIDNEFNDLPYLNNTDRAVKPRMESNIIQSRHMIVGKNLHTYNNRLLASDTEITYSKGTDIFPGVSTLAGQGSQVTSLKFCYVISREDGQTMYVEGDPVVFESGTTPIFYLTYPDARCKKCIIVASYVTPAGKPKIVRYYEVEMKESLSEDMAFFIVDGKAPLLENLIPSPDIAGVKRVELNESEISDGSGGIKVSATAMETNRLYITKSSNFYIYDSVRTMSSDIIGFGAATRPLSTGQFGQYPIYIFTKDGVWSLEVTADGGFGRCSPVSRDVCLCRSSICNLDQAVAFSTAKGIMMITGGDISCLSLAMAGPEDEPEDTDLLGMIGSRFSLYDQADASMGFLDYIRSCSIAFDSVNDRLIIFQGDGENSYQYVYMFRTNSWHRQVFGIRPTSPVNSYPDCWLNGVDGNGISGVYVYSRHVDPSISEDTETLIYTRPFDLGMPDVRKAITDIRIRGKHDRYMTVSGTQRPKVVYVLLGSMDGNTYNVLPSLRGGSYKFFRLMILGSLKCMEKLSWVDVEFEPRFNQKLR